MPSTEPVEPSQTVKKPRAKRSKAEPTVTEVVAEIREEMAVLKGEVLDIRELLASQNQIRTPLEPDSQELQNCPEVAAEEPELELLDSGLSTDELDALMTATEMLGRNVEPNEVDAEPIAVETKPGTALSDDEITALFAASGGPQPTMEQPSEIDAPIVPADEILAMLGLADPVAEEAPEPDRHIEIATPELVSEDPVVKEPEIEAELPDDIPNLEEIDPSAIERVPGALAAAALALPVCIVGENLHCLCIEPFDDEALKALSEAVGMAVVPHSGEPARVLREIRLRFGSLDEVLRWPA